MTSMPPIIHMVDDDVSFRTAMGNLLSACGYTVALYESATQLLKTPPNDEPACILLDVQMAGVEWPAVAGSARQVGSSGCPSFS